MTNLVSKSALLARINAVMNGLESFDAVAELLAKAGASEVKGSISGQRAVMAAIRQGLLEGIYDVSFEEVLAEAGVSAYTEESEDTEDMDDEAPEESRVVILPPAPSDKEREDLIRWYRANGYCIDES